MKQHSVEHDQELIISACGGAIMNAPTKLEIYPTSSLLKKKKPKLF